MSGYTGRTPEEWEGGVVLTRSTWEARKNFCPLCHAVMDVTDTSVPHDDTIALRCPRCGNVEVHYVRPEKRPPDPRPRGRLIEVDFKR